MENNLNKVAQNGNDFTNFLFSQEEANELCLESEPVLQPITEGLGFHHDKQEAAFTLNETRFSSNKSNAESSVKQNEVFDGLKAFYNNAPLEQVTKINNEKGSSKIRTKEKAKLKNASFTDRVIAFVIDLLLIVSINFVMILIFSFVTKHNLNTGLILEFLKNEGLILLPILLTSNFFYFWYFNSQKIGTLGLQQRKIIITAEDNNRIGLTQSFVRTFFIFFSLILFFLPVMLNYQNKLFRIRLKKIG